MNQEKLCIISMSGGLDSTTLAYKALEDGYTVLPVNIKYGQKNVIEREAFKTVYTKMVEEFGDRVLQVTDIDLTAVMKTNLDLYMNLRDTKVMEDSTDMEFYTPSRNLVFTVLSSMIGEIAAFASGIKEIKIGLGIHKHTVYDRDYWDISPAFVEKINEVFALNDCMQVQMYAPYSDVNKSEIVRDAVRLNVPIKNTWTCYNPEMVEVEGNTVIKPCLECEACIERQKAGEEIRLSDINEYNVTLSGDINAIN